MSRRRLAEQDIREIIRQHVGCIAIQATCEMLGIGRRTYYRVLQRRSADVLALHLEADRMAVLYPLLFGLSHAPGDAKTKLGHRHLQLTAYAASAGLADPVHVKRGTSGRPVSVADALAKGALEPPGRRDRKDKEPRRKPQAQ